MNGDLKRHERDKMTGTVLFISLAYWTMLDLEARQLLLLG